MLLLAVVVQCLAQQVVLYPPVHLIPLLLVVCSTVMLVPALVLTLPLLLVLVLGSC